MKKENEVIDENKKATQLKKYFKDHIDDILKTLLELYEFQENIKFVNSKVIERGE